MKWITLKMLQRDFGLSWMVAEPIIRDQCARVRNHSGWISVCLNGFNLGAVIWAFAAPGGLMPHASGWVHAALSLPALAVVVLTQILLPRPLATDAILAAAKAHSEPATAGAATP